MQDACRAEAGWTLRATLASSRVTSRTGHDPRVTGGSVRGAFDLLGIRAGLQLGIQVKRSALPLRFSRAAWNRLHADAKRLDWRFVVAAVTSVGVTFLDPAKARVGKAVTLAANAEIKNLLAWL